MKKEKDYLKMGESYLLDNNTIKNYLQYSEEPKQLEELIKELEISFKLVSVERYFDADKEDRIKANIIIKRGGRIINFDYGMSIRDTKIIMSDPIKFNSGGGLIDVGTSKKYFRNYYQAKLFKQNEVKKIKERLLYDVLTCCGMDYNISIDFDDFCSNFGYDNDSIKAKNTWEKSLKQSSKLQKIFNDDDVSCLPS